MDKKYLLIGLLIGAGLTAGAQDTVRMTLDSCLNYAYEHNLTVRTARLSKESAENAYRSAKWNFAPMLNASAGENLSIYSGGTSLNGNAGVNASMTLFSGLSNLRTLQQSKMSVEQSDLKVQQSENNIASQIIQAYLTIVMNKERLEYQEKVLTTSDEQRTEGKLKYEVGRMLESDYQLLEANYMSALSNIENTRLTIENNRMALRSLLCMKEGEVVDAEPTGEASAEVVLPTLRAVMEAAYENLPDLKIGKMNVDIAKYNVKIAKSAFSPTLGLSAGANYYGGGSQQLDETSGTIVNGGNISGSVGLNLNIPILRGNSITQVKQSKIQLRQAQMELDQTELDLRKTIEGQYLTTKQALNQYKASEMLKGAYEANYNVYVLKYGEGAVTTVDMLQQQDKFLSALNDYLQNKYTFILDQKVLDIYMGKK